MLKIGNSKLSKVIAIFDLPAIKTCVNCELCKNTCYAMKAQRMYKHTKAFRDNNYNESLKESFVDKINMELMQLRKKGIKYIRIHSSGDFYSNEYLNKWIKIAELNRDLIFYSYTKAYKTKQLFLPDNLIIHQSYFEIDNKPYINYDNIENIIILKDKIDGYICPDTLGHEGIHCGITCLWCMTKQTKQILFVKH
jgi:hypothetical protein